MSDIIRRLAISEPLTEDEMKMLVWIKNNANLYTVLTAANQMAMAQGVKLNISVSRTPVRFSGRRRS